MTALTLYNSLNRKKEKFHPIDENHVRIYACGPTVYNYAHIGNARMAVVFDLWVRVLKALHPRVTYVSNITDIDDKIITASQKAGVDIADITKKFTAIYNQDMASLGVLKPDIQPHATHHIDDMIKLCTKLIANGHAYVSENHVLFDVASYPAYGALSGRSTDDQMAGARIDVESYKKNAGDFVLWKPSSDDEPGWDSPYGRGRPGWHIECSAMAAVHLGLPFDIHGGGADLKFPHHENEIAQSCCAEGIINAPESFSKYWLHNGFVTVDGEKMSKSLGNVLLVHDLIKDTKGEVLRLALLSAHYRQPLDWSDDKIHQAQTLLDKLYKKLDAMKELEAKPNTPCPDNIMAGLCDDLNTPKVFAALNTLIKQENSPATKADILAVGNLLGILQEDPEQWFAQSTQNISADIDEAYINTLITERAQAKTDKNYARADEIRDELTAMNIEITDTPDGTTWKTT